MSSEGSHRTILIDTTESAGKLYTNTHTNINTHTHTQDSYTRARAHTHTHI
jgi:hypothetical protein